MMPPMAQRVWDDSPSGSFRTFLHGEKSTFLFPVRENVIPHRIKENILEKKP